MKREFAPEDWTIPLRTVGSFEYLNALAEFGELVDISTESEIDTFNKLISGQDEYAIFSGKWLDELRSKLVKHSQSPEQTLADKKRRHSPRDSKKHSLQWMMALARVELGASLAMYGHIEGAFELVRPAKFGLKEYNLVVADDAASHTQALLGDAKFKQRAKKADRVDSDTVAYLRRMKVANDLLEYASSQATGEDQATSEIQAMINGTIKELNSVRKKFSQLAELATIDLAYEKSNRESDIQVSTRTTHRYSDVESRSPILRRCQQLFLDRNGKR